VRCPRLSLPAIWARSRTGRSRRLGRPPPLESNYSADRSQVRQDLRVTREGSADPVVEALVALLGAVEAVQRDPRAIEGLDREVEDVFSILSGLTATETAKVRSSVVALRAKTNAQYILETIDLILRNIPEG
jgi:hypothetical protein